MPLDSQQIEILGRNLLISELLRNGIEIAIPLRDNGVDPLTYLDLRSADDRQRIVPIQLKSSTESAWGLKKKYEKIRDLRIVYVWWVSEAQQPTFLCMTYQQALAVLDERGYANSNAWTQDGTYAVNGVGSELQSKLSEFAVLTGNWQQCLFGD